MLTIAVATLRHRLTAFAGAFLALMLGTAMIGMMTSTLAATFGTPHPGPQRFAHARAVVAPLGFDGRPMKAPAVLPPEIVARVSAGGSAIADRSFPTRLSAVGAGPSGGSGGSDTTGHPWSAAAHAGYRLVAGRAPASAAEIVVGGGTEAQLGRRVEVAAHDGAADYRVVGVTAARWFERAVFFTDAEAARRSPGVNALVVDGDRALPPTTPTGSGAVLLRGRALTRIDPDATGGAQALANAQAMAGSTTGLAVCVAVFVVVATFAFATEQRRRELALLRLVGAAPGQVRRMVLGEALLIGLAAALAGCALAPLGTGPLRSWMLDHDVAPSWFTIPVNPVPLLISFAIGVLAALVGASATLLRVSLIRPIEVLRESVVERRTITPFRLLLGLGMLIGAVVAGTVVARNAPYLAVSVRKYEAVPLLYVGAVALLGPILLRPVTALLLAPLRRSPSAGSLLVRANLRTSRRRTAATVAPIVVAVGLVGTLLTVQRSGDAATLARQRQEIHAAEVVVPGGDGGLDARTLARLTAVPGIRVTPVASMNIRIGTAAGEQIDSLRAVAVAPAALGDTVTPPVRAGSLAALPADFLVVDEHAAESGGLAAGDRVVVLLPTGVRVSSVIAAVVARGLTGDDTYVSSAFVGAVAPDRVYLDSAAGTGVPLDARQSAAVREALGGSGARVSSHASFLAAEGSRAARQTRNAAVVILGIALAYALIAVANTLIMAVSGRRREFALLGLAGVGRGRLVRICAAEAIVAVVVGTVLGAVATVLAAVTQHASLHSVVPSAPTVIPWTPIGATVLLCTLVTVATAAATTWRATRGPAVPAAGIRE